MSANRLWSIGAVVVILAIVAGTWFIGISPRLTEIATVEASKQGVIALNKSHEATLANLKVLNEKLPELQSQLEELHGSIPTQAEQDVFVSATEAAAVSAGVVSTLVEFGDPTFYVPPAEPPADSEFASALQSIGENKLVVLPVKMMLEGTRAQVFAALSSIQRGERLFLLHDVVFADGYGAADSAVKAAIEGQIFVFLDEALAGAVVDAGSGGATVPPSSDSGPQPE